MNVVVIEDDTLTRVLLDRFLTGQGFFVRSFGSLSAAREAVQGGRPDVILADWYGSVAKDKDFVRSAEVPVVIMSAADDEHYNLVREAAEQAGAAECIRKPFDLPGLVRLLRERGGVHESSRQ